MEEVTTITVCIYSDLKHSVHSKFGDDILNGVDLFKEHTNSCILCVICIGIKCMLIVYYISYYLL